MENPSSYSSISTTECEKIVDIIKEEFAVRKKNHDLMSKIQQEITELTVQRNILSKRKKFNEKCCILCCSSLLFRRKILCHGCRFWVCRSCASWEVQYKTWICEVCEKQRYLDAESWAWFYGQLRLKFSRFGSAKVLENLWQRRKTSDSENDSGYGPSCDYRPLLSLFSFNSKDSHIMADCEEEEDVGEEDAEIHHSIETIVEGLLGSTLDDAPVDRVYMNFHYERIFSTFHSQLINAVQNLSNSLRRALHNMPHDNGMSPTVALVGLKHLIAAVVKDCMTLPFLQPLAKNEIECQLNSMSFADVDIFSSYEGLVASAIINKVIEENQVKYLKDNENIKLHHTADIENEKTVQSQKSLKETEKICMTNEDNSVEGFTEKQLPLECVQIEEVEEITREYTDSEDDKFSCISYQSSGLQSIEELNMQRGSSEMDIFADESQNHVKIPFPEFGPDLVDDVDRIESSPICHPIVVTSWEENWLFRKKRRLPLYSNMKYQLLTYCDEPPCMLIPFPSRSNDTLQQESSSELSETHSVGSLEFSSDSDAQSLDMNQQNAQLSADWQGTEGNSIKSSFLPQASDNMSNLIENEDSNVHRSYNDEICIADMQDYENSEVYCITNNFKHDISMNQQDKEPVQDCLFASKNIEFCKRFKIPKMLSDETPSHRNESHCSRLEIENTEDCETVDGIYQIPTQPGTIAEREHNKWLNAIPLKNNPYSAENISKRNNILHKSGILSNVTLFEQRLNDLCHSTTNEPLQKKLNCGLKSIDGNLYKRDYYVNHFHCNGQEDHTFYMSLPNFDSFTNENCEGVPEEALNSLEEKVYISAGKVFTLENHVKRLERELKEMCLPSNKKQCFPSSMNCTNEMVTEEIGNVHRYQCSPNHDDNLNLPSVRVLATKFSPSNCNVQVSLPFEKVPLQKSDEAEKVKKPRPCMKVHSLTARSLSREFRDRAKKNIPKPMNRLLSVPSQVNDENVSEHESLCSPVSAPSPVNIPQPELTHGYTSDESSTSTNSLPRLKIRRHISRSILQRASYWERRAEQGLLSDASVNEEFPVLKVNPH